MKDAQGLLGSGLLEKQREKNILGNECVPVNICFFNKNLQYETYC